MNNFAIEGSRAALFNLGDNWLCKDSLLAFDSRFQI